MIVYLDMQLSEDILRQYASQTEHIHPECAEILRSKLSWSQNIEFYEGMISGLGIAYGQMSDGEHKVVIGKLIAALSYRVNRMRNQLPKG